jgi:histidinol-phosphate aminotransferase
MKELVRKSVLDIAAYQPGKPIDEIKRQLKLRDVIKLASNENPIGVSKLAKEKIKKAVSSINRYPDGNCFYLRNALSKKLKIRTDNLMFGNGSDEIIDIIIKTFVEDEENVITADITFLEYEIISKVNNRQIITVPLRYFKYDLEGLKKRVNNKTKLIFISNPNNPTGTYVNRYEVDDFLKGLSENVIVVFDEAYDLFVDVNDFPDSFYYLNKKNVIILKTFSKAYGLAGLRIGFAVARPELISYMERVRQPFNVNALAQVAAMAAIEDRKFLNKTRRLIIQGRRYICKELDKSGITYIPTVANFILIDAGKDGLGVFRSMLKYGVIVRDMQQYGLKNFIRVTVGTQKENQRFIRILKKVLT